MFNNTAPLQACTWLWQALQGATLSCKVNDDTILCSKRKDPRIYLKFKAFTNTYFLKFEAFIQ
jgi:hypothetical protein